MKLEVENLISEFVYQGEDRPDLTNVINGEIGMFHFATNKSIVLAMLPFMCGGREVVHNIEICNRIHDAFEMFTCDQTFSGDLIHLAAHRAFHSAAEWMDSCFECDGHAYDRDEEIVRRSFVKIGSVIIQAKYAINIFRMRMALCDKVMTIATDTKRNMVLVRFNDPENRRIYAKILVMGVMLEYAEKGSCVYDSETAELLEVK